MIAKKPANQRALEYLSSLTDVRSHGAQRLPSIKEMAKEAGVSAQTMWTAVDKMRNAGILEVRPKRGITILNPEKEMYKKECVKKETGPKWGKVSKQIQTDILNCYYNPGAPLLVKQLSTHYGVCSKTLFKALADLCRKKLISRVKNYYHVCEMPKGSSLSTVVLIVAGNQQGNAAAITSRTHDHLRIMELECSHANINLQIVTTYDTPEGLKTSPPLQTLLKNSRKILLGYLLWPMGMSRWEPIYKLLAQTRKPIAIFDETGEDFWATCKKSDKINIVSLSDNRETGREAARYLLRLGHRKLAYISPVHNNTWSKSRLQGLHDVFNEAGIIDAISEFTLENHFPCEFLNQTHNVFSIIENLLTNGSAPINTESDAMLSRTVKELNSSLKQVLQNEGMYKELQKQFEKAFVNRNITAWVGANDTIALEGLRFIERNGKQVPKDISVIGFDDSLESFFQKLTSFNFNSQSALKAMLACILGGGPHSDNTNKITINGSIVCRNSTAACLKC